MQLFLNYIKVEEEVFKFTKDTIKTKFLQKKESQVVRFFMNIMLDKDNDNTKVKELIHTMESWEYLQ